GWRPRRSLMAPGNCLGGGGEGTAAPAGVVPRLDGLPRRVEPDGVGLDQRLDAAARRVAVVLALLVSEVAHTGGGQPLERLRVRPLLLEERPLVACASQGVFPDVSVAA